MLRVRITYQYSKEGCEEIQKLLAAFPDNFRILDMSQPFTLRNCRDKKNVYRRHRRR